jgi:heat shock protein HslJ
MRIRFPLACLLVLLALATSGCLDQQPAAPLPTPAPPAITTVTTTAPALPPALSGTWILTTFGIGGGTTVTRPQSEITLTLNADGSLAGFGGCNNYFGSFALTGDVTPKGPAMKISNLGATRKYCQGESGDEQQYLAILGRTAACSGEADFLTLTADNGDSLGFRRPGAATVGAYTDR